MVVLALMMGLGLVLVARLVVSDDGAPSPNGGATTTAGPGATGSTVVAGGPTTTVLGQTTVPASERPEGTVPGWTVGMPWGTTSGLTMFRGNPTRTYYGEGPAPTDPGVLWRTPQSGGLCGESTNLGDTKTWCGTGWTGQPVVWERPDGVTELIFGAYDHNVHFLDAATGEPTRSAFETGDLVKGSGSLDPDGYPLIYFGSRDNKLRIVALDRGEPTELWSMDATDVEGTWNDDWDGDPVILDDILYEGGENGWFFAIRLNRGYDSSGLATVDPEVLFEMPSYDQEFIDLAGINVSIENSVAVYDQRVYFANSGGRIMGLDVSDVRSGKAPVVFDYWAGGDIDATLVVDEDGMLYASVNVKPDQVALGYRTQANIDRTREVGQILKLDPYRDGDPRVWGVDLTAGSSQAGSWSTVALHQGLVYVNSMTGDLMAIDGESGDVVWTDGVGWHTWSSPVIVDDSLLTTTCTGELRSYSLADPRRPVQDWSLQISDSCIEATPAVWKGSAYFGSRDGGFYAVGG
jgi:hypothetical protein